MTVYLRNIQNVVRAYGRQVGRRPFLKRPKDPQDRVTISDEGRQRLLEDIARRLQQKKSTARHLEEKNKKLFFKMINAEGEEILEEISPEKQPQLLEKLVEKIAEKTEEKELSHENR